MFLAESGVTITSAVSSIMGIVSTMMTTITSNAILMAFMCAALIGIAIAVIKKLVGRY